MIKIKPSETEPTILAFDGEILECFFMDGSKRVHITHIKGIQLNQEDKGKHLLDIGLKYDHIYVQVDEEAFAKVNELIAGVQNAKAAFKL